MSDHPKEAERNLKRIFICDDNCLNLFHWLAPKKVGLELATVSRRFDALVDSHFRTRKWALGTLRIVRSINSCAAVQIVKVFADGSVKRLPVPQTALPNCVIGFRRITICFDICSAEVIAFLQRIGRLLGTDIFLVLDSVKESDVNNFAASFWPLLGSGVVRFRCENKKAFQSTKFRRFIVSSLLCGDECNSNLSVLIGAFGPRHSFTPADGIDGDESSSSDIGHAVYKWLHTPCQRSDGSPKVLKLKSCLENHSDTMEALKTTFLGATVAVSFIIVICWWGGYGVGNEPFELINLRTRERLTMRHRRDNYCGRWTLIGRCPMDQDGAQWAHWESEAMEEGTNVWWKVIALNNCL